jgi:hypothetical protein
VFARRFLDAAQRAVAGLCTQSIPPPLLIAHRHRCTSLIIVRVFFADGKMLTPMHLLAASATLGCLCALTNQREFFFTNWRKIVI